MYTTTTAFLKIYVYSTSSCAAAAQIRQSSGRGAGGLFAAQCSPALRSHYNKDRHCFSIV